MEHRAHALVQEVNKEGSDNPMDKPYPCHVLMQEVPNQNTNTMIPITIPIAFAKNRLKIQSIIHISNTHRIKYEYPNAGVKYLNNRIKIAKPTKGG